MYDIAMKMVEDGLLTVRRDESNPLLEVFCYSRDAFYTGNWNSVTLSHRGALYYGGKMVNKPFDKIFNIGEVDGVDHTTIKNRMETEHFDVLHKSNGHLLICSHFYDDSGESHIVWSTKGSLPNKNNELLNQDIALVNEPGGLGEKVLKLAMDVALPFTLMFEAVVSHDKHALFYKEIERYSPNSKNVFVLLGMNTLAGGEWRDAPFSRLEQLKSDYGFTLVQHFDGMSPNLQTWYDHKNTEGYVIRFGNGDRVKVKTKEYWSMRFKKDLMPEQIVNKFRIAGYDRIESKLPEEISDEVIPLIKDSFECWLIDVWANLNDEEATKHFDRSFRLVSSDRDIVEDKTLTKGQKDYMLHLMNGGDFEEFSERCSRSKSTRKEFCKWFGESTEHKEAFSENLDDIVENIGKFL